MASCAQHGVHPPRAAAVPQTFHSPLRCSLGGFLIVKNNSGTSKCRRRPVASPPPPQRIQQKPVPSPVYAGSAAPYSAALTSASKLACGYPVLSPWQGTNFAAINAAQASMPPARAWRGLPRQSAAVVSCRASASTLASIGGLPLGRACVTALPLPLPCSGTVAASAGGAARCGAQMRGARRWRRSRWSS